MAAPAALRRAGGSSRAARSPGRFPSRPPRRVRAGRRPEAPAPPSEVRRELIRVPESVTVGELAEKMRRKSGEVIKALLELGVMAR
jgi:translation initiation factor IF-2